MTARLIVPLAMAVVGWQFLTPFTTAWLLSQLPLLIVAAGWLLESPPAAARSARPAAHRLVYRRPAVVVVMRPTPAAAVAAWQARQGVMVGRRA